MTAKRKEHAVKIWTDTIVIPTYLPFPPDKNPMFLEKRVYQGSSGKVYPLPFTDRISEQKTDRSWTAVYLENEYVQVMILPEIGGRIHAIFDKISNYDLIYRQDVIKPALVGLAGSWISGGIEFNWAQHHRPSTFMPVDFEIEEHDDGSKTLWCSEHEPMTRMKGMHGVCLNPRSSAVELKVRVYNRTNLTNTFLWWANAAVKVHEGYQSFFPPDVCFVADHAKRATTGFPLCEDTYYGINYGARGKGGIPEDEMPSKFISPHATKTRTDKSDEIPPYLPNDLSWYANIPVPTSYMCVGSKEDFFGGYDHLAKAGIVHVADHRIAPGKKQWTWGNHEFGYAWDRNLSDDGAPYIELMAGVFTDNQPDFSFLGPGETKSWSQYWYGIRDIGAPVKANREAALGLTDTNIGVCVTTIFDRAKIRLESGEKIAEWTANLRPDKPFLASHELNKKEVAAIRVFDEAGREIIAYSPNTNLSREIPAPATEPQKPSEVKTSDELYLTGLHLAQYNHATRDPEACWREAVRRDPGDWRSNNALGLAALRRGEFLKAERFFRVAINRLTTLNPNPADGEAFYNLGLCLQYQIDGEEVPNTEKTTEIGELLYKATWNQGVASAAFYALAEMDCRARNWKTALDHLDRSLKSNGDNLRARNLKAVVLKEIGRGDDADLLASETVSLDHLDWWARFLNGEKISCDTQTRLDVAHDLARAGFYKQAIELFGDDVAFDPGTGPIVCYTLGWFHSKIGEKEAAIQYFIKGGAQSPDYCFPYRLEEIAVLKAAIDANPSDWCADLYLGNLLYDRRRHTDAIELWEFSAALNPNHSVTWRNLGIAYFNISKKPKKALAAYEKAFAADNQDARLLYERDQLWKRTGRNPAKRLSELEKYPDLTARRDDLSIELCALLNQTGKPEKALNLLESRRFQPWEGGEGEALRQYTRARVLLGRRAHTAKDYETALKHFGAALEAPANLGEARHVLANISDINFWLGEAYSALGNRSDAEKYWTKAADFKGDFQEMRVREFSEMTYFSALAMMRLGRPEDTRKLLHELRMHTKKLLKEPAVIDYFATSLPAMLLFEDDIQARQENAALVMRAQATLGLGNRKKAAKIIRTVMERDPVNIAAADLIHEIENRK